jgi:N-acetylneuraminate synthase
MSGKCKIGDKWISAGGTVFLAANIGVNHNGEPSLIKRMVEAAARAGCDSVVFQKCLPERHIPVDLQKKMLATPWGDMTYLEFRRRVEIDEIQFQKINALCRVLGISWAVTVRDIPSVDSLARLHPDYLRVPSAVLTNVEMLEYIGRQGIPVMLCAGSSTLGVVKRAVKILGHERVVILHGECDRALSPLRASLNGFEQLRANLTYPVGVSGCELDFSSALKAFALGARVLERPLTLDRSLWGANQKNAADPIEFERFIRQIRYLENALTEIKQKRHWTSISRPESPWQREHQRMGEEMFLPEFEAGTAASIEIKSPPPQFACRLAPIWPVAHLAFRYRRLVRPCLAAPTPIGRCPFAGHTQKGARFRFPISGHSVGSSDAPVARQDMRKSGEH